jgi:carboxyl-terminal processing protease
MTKPLRRSSGWIAACALTILALALAGSVRAPASTSVLPPGAIAPTDAQRATARKIGRILEDSHYSHAAIDDKMSEQVYQRYLDFLDSQRSYFLASDIAEFSAYRLKFGDIIRTGAVEPAYVIFNRFQQRNRERVQYALSLLSTEPDWTVNESYEFDRAKTPWPASPAEINDLWRKRVKQDALSLVLAGKTWADASDILRKRYEHVLKRVDQVSTDDVFEGLMNAYARSFDPHSSYFSPRNSEEYRITMSLNYEGIGASLQQEDDYVKILNVIEGGPASVAGTLNQNDRIVGVGQGKDGAFTDVIGWRLDDVVQLIRGKAGTLVRLEVLPAGAAPGSPQKTLEFVRGKVTLENQAAHKEVKTITRNGKAIKVGIITVPGFYQDIQAQNAGDQNYRSTTRDVLKLVRELKAENVDGLVLDLRDDGGGYLPEATALTGLFIDHGPVVQLRDNSGTLEVLDDPEPAPVYDGPLAVLVNRYSASASEIFAGAIQDYHRGLILGQRTFGKGTVQSLMPLDRWSNKPSSGQLTVTIGKFYRVTGESTQHRGVEPDVTLPSAIDMKEVGESSLEAALPWDRIAGVPFRLSSGPAAVPPVARLISDEDVRSQRDPDYRWLVSDIAAIDQLREQKTVSLNLNVRKAERAHEETERLSRENSRRAAKGLPAVKTLEEMEKACPAPAAGSAKPQPSNRENGGPETGPCKDDLPDVVLMQAAEIMGDMVSSGSTARPPVPAQKTARRG